MKRHLFWASLGLLLTFSSTAFADEYDKAIDILTGDFIGVLGINADVLSSRELYKDPLIQSWREKALDDALLSSIAKAGYDIEKDFDNIVYGLTPNQQQIAIVSTAKKPLEALAELLKLDDRFDTVSIELKNGKSSHEYFVLKRQNLAIAISDQTLIVGHNSFVIDSLNRASRAKDKSIAGKRKLHQLVTKAPRNNDIWMVAIDPVKLNSRDLSQIQIANPDNAAQTFEVKKLQDLSLGIDLKEGLLLQVKSKLTNETEAKSSTTALNGSLSQLMQEPIFESLGLGFVKNSYTIQNAKSYLNARLKLSNPELRSLIALAAVQLN